MANRWPISSGNWSNAAIWSGSLIPTASDDVFANGQTITIDTNISVRSISNGATGSAVAGGSYEIYNDITITSTNGIYTGTTTGANITTGMVRNYGTGSLTIIGTLTRPNATQGYSVLQNYNSGNITILGDILGVGAGGSGVCLRNRSNGNITVIGNVTAGNTSAAHAIYNDTNGNITITGNVIGGTSGTTNNGILNNGAGKIIVTGNVTGGSGGINTGGIYNSSAGSVFVTGTVTGGTVSTTAAGIESADGTINVIGTCQASSINSAIETTATKTLLTGPLINSGSKTAIYCDRIYLYKSSTTSYTLGLSGSSNNIILYSTDQIKVPTQNNVRYGVSYGVSNEFTGSMQIPHPNSVSYGVLVDNTTGSAVTTATDVWNYAITSLTSSNSIGQRLANAASSASVALMGNFFG